MPLLPRTFRSLLVATFCCAILRFVLLPAAHADEFSRGDTEDNGGVELTDSVRIFAHLFLGSVPLFCEDAADTNDNGEIDTTDGVFLLNFLFLGRAAPPAPFPGCGDDPTDDALGCDIFTACREAGLLELSLETSGGFAGVGSTNFHLEAGVLTVVRPFPNSTETRGELTEDQATRLLEAALAVDWAAVEPSYIPKENPGCCCDQIITDLSVTHNALDEESTTVSTGWCSATGGQLPQELQAFLAVLAEVGFEVSTAGSVDALELELQSTGGFSGRGSTDFILRDGTLTVREPFGKPAECTTDLTPEQLARLLDAAAVVNWRGVAPSYRPPDNPQCCCDQFISQLTATVTRADGTATDVQTTWCEVPSDFPAALEAFLRELQAVGDEVLPTCQE